MVHTFNMSGIILSSNCQSDECNPYSFSFDPGIYKFELWGARGGGSLPGYGAYVSGVLRLNRRRVLFIYCGEQGVNGGRASWNGGGSGKQGGSSGGGSTDVRLVGGNWSTFESLKNRIIVAGGGGGSQITSYLSQGGHAGGLTGSSGSKEREATEDVSIATGGSQTAGGIMGEGRDTGLQGQFGYGGSGSIGTGSQGSGGGSGYFGGGGSATSSSVVGSGAGGSSFVSGYHLCSAIDNTSSQGNILFSGSSVHYSGLEFMDIVFISGNSLMPSGTSSIFNNGWNGNGAARITQFTNKGDLQLTCLLHVSTTPFLLLLVISSIA